MSYMQNADFASAGKIAELSFDEVLAVSGGDGETTAQRVTNWGSDTVTAGAATAGAGALVTQADSPLPGPADAVGGVMTIAGVATVVIGEIAYIGGSIGQLFER